MFSLRPHVLQPHISVLEGLQALGKLGVEAKTHHVRNAKHAFKWVRTHPFGTSRSESVKNVEFTETTKNSKEAVENAEKTWKKSQEHRKTQLLFIIYVLRGMRGCSSKDITAKKCNPSHTKRNQDSKI